MSTTTRLDASNSRELLAFWTGITEAGIESGHPPILGLGVNALSPTGIPALMALGDLTRTSSDRSAPFVVAGSEGALWMLFALRIDQIQHGEANSAAAVAAAPDSQTHIAFGGADAVTFAASLNLYEEKVEPSGIQRPPGGLAWLMTHSVQPGSQSSEIDFLPFHLADDAFLPATPYTLEALWSERLETWLGLLLVLALVATAFLL